MVCEWREERLSIRLKKIKRATAKWGVKCKEYITLNFLYIAKRLHGAKLDCSLTFFPPILGWVT